MPLKIIKSFRFKLSLKRYQPHMSQQNEASKEIVAENKQQGQEAIIQQNVGQAQPQVNNQNQPDQQQEGQAIEEQQVDQGELQQGEQIEKQQTQKDKQDAGQENKQNGSKKIIGQNQRIAQMTEIDKENCINKLQVLLTKNKVKLQESFEANEKLQNEVKTTKQSLKKVRFQFLTCKQQLSTLQHEKKQALNQVNKLQQQLKSLTQKLQVYKEVGDIGEFKNKIIELQNLIKIQKQEISVKQKMIDQKQQGNKPQSQSKVSVLEMIQKNQNQNKQLKALNQTITKKIEQLNKKSQKMILQTQNLNKLLEDQRKINSDLSLKLNKLQEQISQKQVDYNQKLKKLNENILTSVNNTQVEYQVMSECRQERYGIKILSPEQERDLILRKYIELELDYSENKEKLQNAKERHYKLLKEFKSISATHISKNQYNQLYKKYSKLRKCLQNSLSNEETLKKKIVQLQANCNSNYLIMNAEQNQTLNRKILNANETKQSTILSQQQQPQNPIVQIENVMQSSNASHKYLQTLKQQLQSKQKLIRYQKQLAKQSQKIEQLEGELQHSQNILTYFDNEIGTKRRQIQYLNNLNKENIEKLIKFQKGYVLQNEHRQQIRQNSFMKSTLEMYQIKNIQLLKENSSIKAEKNMLNELYVNMKAMYEEIMKKQPEKVTTQMEEENVSHKETKNNTIDNGKCSKCEEREAGDKIKAPVSVGIQTQLLADLYFKEIKDLLIIIRKFPKKIDSITAMLEGQKNGIGSIKLKLDQNIENYQSKVKLVEEEKKSNDKWRNQQKQKIREQFQQIRDLIINERLLSSLRKAKSLIEYYEQKDQNGEQQEQQKDEQKNQDIEEQKGDGEKKVDQKSQNKNEDKPIVQKNQNEQIEEEQGDKPQKGEA